MIRFLARVLPSKRGSLDRYSSRINGLLQRFPNLFFIGKRQRCLIRGFLLFFFGKRLNQDVRLRFGSKRENGILRTHCWIVQGGTIRFDDEESIGQYVVLVEYS
ncbi:lasso peptide biosynthesis protein [Thermodesulfobacteriota bacterium]